jgi:hypothetical protein
MGRQSSGLGWSSLYYGAVESGLDRFRNLERRESASTWYVGTIVVAAAEEVVNEGYREEEEKGKAVADRKGKKVEEDYEMNVKPNTVMHIGRRTL